MTAAGTQLFDLSGRTALITGASRGIGRMAAETLAAAGARVILTARSRDALVRLADGMNVEGREAIALPLDITDEEAVLAAIARLEADGLAPDILVNNGGVIDGWPREGSQGASWRTVVETNLVAPYVLCREVSRTMRRRKWGRIVNIASILAIQGKKNAHAYSATKHGIAGLTRALAAELGGEGITANAICPGYIRTEINVSLQEDARFSAMVEARVPAGRWGETGDLAGPLLFLCSEASAFVNGHLLVVDGGMTATH